MISSGIKLMVMAIIIGIGTTLFADFINSLNGNPPTIKIAASLILGALSLLGLGIFAPAIGAGLVSGAPQLGAGAVVGTIGAVAAGAAVGIGGAAAGMSVMSSAVKAGASMAGGAASAYQFGQAVSGGGGLQAAASGVASVGKAAVGSVRQGVQNMMSKATSPVAQAFSEGKASAWSATGGSGGSSKGTSEASPDSMPGWAQKMQRQQALKSAGLMALHAVKDGDRPGAPANPEISKNEE
ncbi:MAG: type IV secretion system protein [Opitutaceae bacterium]|nr:type IV secretion system protein [Opitutaceae bacterium]